MNSEEVSGSDCSSVPSFLYEGTSDGGRYGPQNSEIVGILKQLMDETRVDLQTLEKMESELFKAERAPFVKLKDLITRWINRLETEMSHVSHCDEETSMATEKKEDLEADVMSNSTMFTSPEVIDDAELKNVETNRTTMQDTSVGKYNLDGINTREEMNVNDQMITDKQSPDIAGDVHGNKDDLDNSAGDQIIMSEYASDALGGAVPLIHLTTQMDMLHAVQGHVAATLDPRQFEGMPQACVKLENDMTGRVSESQKRFQLGTQFRDTSSEHSTHEHDVQSTHIEHHHQDNMCIATMTDEQWINDDEEKMGKGKQGGNKAIHARYGNRMQAITERNLRQLMEENSGKYVVYDGKIMTPGTIKQLKNHTIVRIVDKMMGGAKKKSRKKQNKEETTSSSESDALQDMFMELMKEDDDKGNNMFRTLMQMDDEMAQEAMSKMKQGFAENGKKFGVQKLSFER